MLPRLPQAAMILAVACSLGLHWAFFQSVAWVGMVVHYAQETTLEQAVANTFDGQHPCRLCQQIAQRRQSEQQSESQPTERKLEFSFSITEFVFSQPRQFWVAGEARGSAATRPLAPPVPPPRALG